MEDSSGGQTTTSTPLLQKAESTTMLCEDLSNNPEVTTMLCDDVIVTDIKEVSNPELTVRDLLLFTQLFYLPAEHGQVGLELLNDFFWLKKNAVTMLPPGKPWLAGSRTNVGHFSFELVRKRISV